MRIAITKVMLPFLDVRPSTATTHHDDDLDAAEIACLRELPPTYARPIHDESDVYLLVAEATEMRDTFTAGGAAIGQHALGAAIARRIRILQQADDELGVTVRMLERARLRLAPDDRTRAAKFAPVLALAVHPRGETDERTLHKAAVWLGSLDCATAARAIETLRRERAVLDADDLRCRAFHALRALLDRSKS